MSETRFSRGKERLILAEQAIQKKRSISRKLGRTLPEETIKIPKIGEWSLADKDSCDLQDSRSKFKVNTRYSTATGGRLDKSRPLSAMAPPCLISPPRVNLSDMVSTEGNTTFPQGTVTTDLTDILKSKYRTLKRPIPPLRPKEEETNQEPQFLPLEMFDDSTYEEFPISELMKNPYAYSKYQEIDGDNYWAPCSVINYDEENRVFTIEWDNGTHKRKKVARFNIRFEQEDPEKFEKRIQAAKKLCTRYENLLRFEARVEQMPTINLPQLSTENMSTFHSRMGMEVKGSYLKMLKELDKEVQIDFQKTNNRLDYKWDIIHNPLIPNREEFMQLFPDPPPIHEYGLIPHQEFNFNALLEHFSDIYLMGTPQIQSGLFTIWGIFQDSTSLTFLTDGFNETIPLDDFISRQYSHLDATTKTFKSSIQETLEGVISSTVSESLANIKPKDKIKYQNMITLTTRMLHTVLMRIVDSTLKRYLSLYSKYLTEQRLKLVPQFSIILQIDENKKISFSPTIDKFKFELTALLSQLESSVNELPIITSPIVEIDTPTVSFEDCVEQITAKRGELDDYLQQLFQVLEDFLDKYRYLETVLGLDPEAYTHDFDPKGLKTLQEYDQQLKEFNKILNVLNSEIEMDYLMTFFHLSCKEFKEKNSQHIRSLIHNFLQQVKSFAMQSIIELKEEFESIQTELQKVPETPEQLAKMKKYLENVYETVKVRNKKMAISSERFQFLEDYHFEITNEEFQLRYKTLQMPLRIATIMDETERTLSVERIRMIRELRANQKKLENDSTTIAEEVVNFSAKYTDLDMTIEAYDQVTELYAKLQTLKSEQEKYNQHEKLFDFEQAQCKPLQKAFEDFAPLHVLWNLANDWTTTSTAWVDTPFPQIRADAMNQFINMSGKKILKLKKDLSEHRDLINNVLGPLQAQIDQLKQRMPLLTKLRHPGIKTKHWEMITNIVGFTVQPSMELTLQNYLDLNLEQWNEQITEIASAAVQEYSLESSLDQMDSDLQTLRFVTVQFRDTPHFILHEIDEIVSTIDDQLVTTQTLLTSPFIGPIKKRAIDRLAYLRLGQETLESWVNCQRSWLYLQPIFSGTSIQQKLFKEARDWNTVDKIWSNTMRSTHNSSSYNDVMHRDQLLPELNQCNELLDSITKGLNMYLETKRLGFPRFFFLSNDELISILSHTKDFSKIQDSMQKLFEYVISINVTDDLEITAMNDAEGECVQLHDYVDGNTAEIEDWLNAFEEEMKNTLKEYTREALAAAPKKKREQWIGDFPAQVILTANQIQWTQQVTTVLKGQKLRGLKLLQSKFIEQLEGLTALARAPISHLLRNVVSCLLIFEVHNRDIISGLIQNVVSDVNAFKWVQQLRYYWEEDTVLVRSINNTYEYSYEYAGNSARLVITPLTDRCYQTLLSAFKQNLSGAPSGPAGTGKTETVRDCAKALGRPCVVYNCSEEVTPEQMSQFFAGLSSSGSWSCFDEFNRINIEVLSVIAQQVRSIQAAIAANAETFQLDARTLKLNVNAAICITMNPGYAGRTELPDNLKALFRPCAMMVPDFQFICEILLFSGGFKTASNLSVKMVALFDLCRKQLSNAHHYDWGMRATKAILSTAAKLKRNDLEADEANLLVNSIRDCTQPRLVSVDLPLFKNIIHDVFPEVVNEKSQPEKLVEKIVESFKALNEQPIEVLIQKTVEYYETTVVRHGIMLVGGAMGGKTSSWKALELAMTNLSKEENSGFQPVHVEHLNPKAISIAKLYGSFNPVTSEWADGVLSQAIRQCSFSEQTELKWIIVDGPVDSLWIESMNSLLDDNKVLCLPNNERIQLGPHVKMVFEVDNLSEASPATVSRCGMVYFDPTALSWTVLADTWADKHKEKYPEVSEYCRGLMDQYLPQMVQFIEVDGKPSMNIGSNFVVMNFLKLLDCFIPLLRKQEEKNVDGGDEVIKVDPLDQKPYFSMFQKCDTDSIPYIEGEQALMIFERAFAFCLVWSFGGILLSESRGIFDKFLKDIMDQNQTRCAFPPKMTVFDYFADFGRGVWLPFTDGSTNINFTIQLPIEQQLIPTQESAANLFLSRLLVNNHTHLLINGPESSKTLSIKTLFNVILDKKKFSCNVLPLANCTTPTNLGKYMMAYMHKHQGAFGPLPNQHLVFLLDSIGSVKPEIYGAQPPLELIRQFFDYGGWFNTAQVEFMNIVNTTLCATMGVPGGGLFDVPQRLLHHFFLLHSPKYPDSSLLDIMNGLFQMQLSRYHPSVKDLIKPAIMSTLSMYDQCVTNLLPIPSKLHYVFSLRNIVRVLKGITLVSHDIMNTDQQFIKVWYHEMMREFYDRFNQTSDRKWFTSLLSEIMNKNFKLTLNQLCPNGPPMFNEFADQSQKYKEVTCTQEQLLATCNATLEENNRDATKPIDIVLFTEAINHLSSLSRIFSMTRGHALLVGVKSSGRKSLARLALHIASFDTFEIAITRTYSFNEWREDLKNLFKQCGEQDLPTGFIITDVQIIMPQQLEDLSNLLINCDIPQMYERDEKDQIRVDMSQNSDLQQEGDLFELFMDRVKRNLHIVLVFSPFGSVFKDSMLSYPALRSETTIDWYMPWSQDALESVGTASLKNSSSDSNNLKSIVSVCVNIHKSVEKYANRFLKETKRFTSVTPSRYFELLNTFNAKLKKKNLENEELINKYSNGVEQIKTTRTQIDEMSQELNRDIPILEKTQGEVEQFLSELNVKSKEVEETRKEVQGKSEIAEAEAKEAAQTNEVAQEQLALAQPILDQAQNAVNKLDKNALVEIKKLHKPSAGMKDTFDAVCIMFDKLPRRVAGEKPGEKVDDYWPEAVSLLNDVQFIKNVQNFKPESLKPENINKLKKYVPVKEELRAEKRKAAQDSFLAVANLYNWVCASFDYWHVYQEILPKKLAAEEAAKKLEATEAILAEAKKHLAEVEATLQALQEKVENMKKQEKELQDKVENTQARLSRAQKILNGLSGETARWSETAENLKNSAQYILGDSLLIAGVLTYMGAFSPSFRTEMLDQWKTFLSKEQIKFTENFTIAQALGNDGTIRDWIVKGLPNDTHSIENALIITQSDQCFPLLIDPQLSGTKWLRSIEGEQLNILRFDQPDFLQRLKGCITFGLHVLITNVGLKLDPLIDPILSRELLNVDGQKRVSLGGEYVPYSDNFRLYISTKYPNPHYSPEICSQVTLINFTTTQDGLTDLLLNNLIEVEREELDKKRIAIMEANAENTQKLREIEKEILQIVSNAGSDILNDDLAIDTLTRAQKTSADIEQQMTASKKTEEQIAQFKENFSVVAKRAALLYFCVSDFSVIDPMYQFSLKWFVSLFRTALSRAEHSNDLHKMVEAFHSSIAMTFYRSVSYSLFSRHKLLFSTLMAIRILFSDHKISGSELAFLLQPVISHDPNPTKILTDEVWGLVASLSLASKTFEGITEHIKQNPQMWENYINSSTPETENVPFPSNLTSFQKLLMVRVFHLQRVREALHIFIEENMGSEFVKPPTLNLTNVFKDSDPLSPLIFIIMPGIDPQDDIISVATTMELDKYFKSYSLGRGRGQGAEELIMDASERGFWVLLQNCHLSLSWMPRLENLLNNLDPAKIHPRFRICLVTMSSPDFPIGILYQGTKLIYEIPKGMRQNVLQIYNGFNQDEYNTSDTSVTEKQLTFHLAFFHAVVLERLQFGSIGWNIPYEFNPSDFYISRRHLKIFLNESNDIPFEALSYVIGELNYGGRVTDRWDRRLLLSLLRRFFSEDINSPNFSFGQRYTAPSFDDSLDNLISTVSSWPYVTTGEDVGLSLNASTITARNEALGIFNSLIEVQPTLVAASDTISEEQFALKLVESLIQQVPQPFNIHNFIKKFNLEDTVSTVLHHEILLYNKLIEVINSSLSLMQKGLKGLIIIDEQLELLNKRLLANKVPEMWLSHSFPSILPLRQYMEDLCMRVEFLDKWVREEKPIIYKLGAFYHPEEFLTAILQVYARKHNVPFDSLAWQTSTVDKEPTEDPSEGIYIYGLPIEGAKWDFEAKLLTECGQKDLINYLPILHLSPTQDKKLYDNDDVYECPVFRTQNRGTGALDLPNYIISLFLPTGRQSPDHWVQRSVAAFITTK
ncbi:Dynein heavy chain family protein [Tritrichomonas foetus]|uniref:Dynein-1, subspecies f n=1 Tax=Tritrichomonas foetus TaxID=1144522 RepID=A0A1J4L362_9EUKA|nr:Dynein heavy chain family protein [Tritrichomonas foetus]|eukprot:OHT16390.1 Dynein heavy chain family protein [Tritrichomonas foetus]